MGRGDAVGPAEPDGEEVTDDDDGTLDDGTLEGGPDEGGPDGDTPIDGVTEDAPGLDDAGSGDGTAPA